MKPHLRRWLSRTSPFHTPRPCCRWVHLNNISQCFLGSSSFCPSGEFTNQSCLFTDADISSLFGHSPTPFSFVQSLNKVTDLCWAPEQGLPGSDHWIIYTTTSLMCGSVPSFALLRNLDAPDDPEVGANFSLGSAKVTWSCTWNAWNQRFCIGWQQTFVLRKMILYFNRSLVPRRRLCFQIYLSNLIMPNSLSYHPFHLPSSFIFFHRLWKRRYDDRRSISSFLGRQHR